MWALFKNVSKDFTKYELVEMSLNVWLYDFSVDHSAIKKEKYS